MTPPCSPLHAKDCLLRTIVTLAEGFPSGSWKQQDKPEGPENEHPWSSSLPMTDGGGGDGGTFPSFFASWETTLSTVFCHFSQMFHAVVTGLVMHPIIVSSLLCLMHSFRYGCFLDLVPDKWLLFESLSQGKTSPEITDICIWFSPLVSWCNAGG